MNLLVKLLAALAVVLAVGAIALVVAGRMGYLAGTAPTDLGVREGRLKPPPNTPNGVSSQANLYPDHPQKDSAQVEPLRYSGEGAAAMARLEKTLAQQPRVRIVFSNDDYLRAESKTALFGFVDDVEFWLDKANGVIHVRSASRLGKYDLGANRKRVEALRAAFARR